MKKTLKQLKEDIKSKSIKLELTYSKYGISEKIKGVRTISRVQTNECLLVNKDGYGSWFSYPKASNMEYIGTEIKIFTEDGELEMVYKVIKEEDEKKVEYTKIVNKHRDALKKYSELEIELWNKIQQLEATRQELIMLKEIEIKKIEELNNKYNID